MDLKETNIPEATTKALGPAPVKPMYGGFECQCGKIWSSSMRIWCHDCKTFTDPPPSGTLH